MATYRFDDKHDATIRPVEKLAPGRYRCQVSVGLTDGTFTDSSFVAERKTAKQAEKAALQLAQEAISAGHIKYRAKDRVTVERIQELRKQEEGCAARISSIQRKLDAGSRAVDQDDLLRWKVEMTKVQNALSELGEAPVNAA